MPVRLLIALVVATAAAALAAPAGAAPGTVRLDRWTLRTSAGLSASPAQLSRPGFRGRGWRRAVVPGSVLASLTRAGVYPNVTYGDRLLAVPSAPFAVPWWYRTEVELPADGARSTVLRLDGLNARGAVWVNGRRVADEATLVGAFRRHRLDITRYVRRGRNAIAVRVQPVDPDRDFTVTWVDWNPHPPDNGMGLWQPVSLVRTGPVALGDVRVSSTLPLPRRDSADLRVDVRVRNATARAVRATVHGSVAGVAIRRTVRLAPRASVQLAFGPRTTPGLRIARPRLWWPHDLGEPVLHDLALAVDVAGAPSDAVARRFGIRDVRSRVDGRGHRVFSVNGRDVLVRAGGWASDILLRQDGARTARQVALARDAGLNALRLEGKFDGPALYAAADRLGVMLLPGWMCCDRFEETERWTPAELRTAASQMADQALALRDHPSVIGFLIGSDEPPTAAVAAAYRRAIDGVGFTQPVIASATSETTPGWEPTGVKMRGPYDWVAPSYWSRDEAPGGARGFATEVGPGASVPELERLPRFLTTADRARLWRQPDGRQTHAGSGPIFPTLGRFSRALAARLGRPTSLADYVRKAQLMQYEANRAQFEAFSAARGVATGVVYWQATGAWPTLHWSLWGDDLATGGGYYGARKANASVHALLVPATRAVVLANDTTRTRRLTVDVRVAALDGRVLWRRAAAAQVGPGRVERLLAVARPRTSQPYLVSLVVREAGAVVDRNVYWLPAADETLAWDETTWYVTPTARHADLRALAATRATVSATACVAGAGTIRATLEAGARPALLVRPRLTAGVGGPDVLPAVWSDSYVSLLPGERQVLTVDVAPRALRGRRPALEVVGFNVPRRRLGALRPC